MTEAPPDAPRVELAEPDCETARNLLESLDRELSTIYTGPNENFLHVDKADLAPGRGAFCLARVGDVAVGCGAVRLGVAGDAELKKMYVSKSHRGIGVGQAVLRYLEATALQLGARRLVLETGDGQPAVLRFYESAGFERIPAFGEYVDGPRSICMAKKLA